MWLGLRSRSGAIHLSWRRATVITVFVVFPVLLLACFETKIQRDTGIHYLVGWADGGQSSCQ
jgi:hypothetical protein